MIQAKGRDDRLLPFLSIIAITDSSRRCASAITAMRLIAERLPEDISRDAFKNDWLSPDTSHTVKNEALRYLGEQGVQVDLADIKKELQRGDPQTATTATEALIRIELREGRQKAIRALYELQPTSVSLSLLRLLFNNAASLDTDILLDGVTHRNTEVRRTVVKALRVRGKLPQESAEQLTKDSDARVRYEALRSLCEAGHQFTDSQAKEILSKPQQTAGLGIFTGLDVAGDACWEEFRYRRLQGMKIERLDELAKQASFFDHQARFVLAERRFARVEDALRESIDDGFEREYQKELKEISAALSSGPAERLREQTTSLEGFLKGKLMRSALSILCRRGDPKDLERVRRILKNQSLPYSADDMTYLRRFGEWDDIPLLVAEVERPDLTTSWLSPDLERYDMAADAIYAIGQHRFADLLSLNAPGRLLERLVMRASEKVFASLSDGEVLSLMRSEITSLRKATALKYARALSKTRVEKLLHLYIQESSYFYNVVHWLDLRVVLPRAVAIEAVEKAIEEDWPSNHRRFLS